VLKIHGKDNAMNIGLFGGTFDPIHHGHIALARAALERFQLSRIYFVPASVPPHKRQMPKATYFDRYAMVVLATMAERAFLPSSLEAPGPAEGHAHHGKAKHGVPGANYSIDTVRRLKQGLKKSDRLFFLIGMDAFEEIATWRESEALFRECEFIVASRPGYSLADVANALPPSLRPASAVTKPFAKQKAEGDLALKGVVVHLLADVHEPVSATAVREAIAAERPLSKFVDAEVAKYIKKMRLYR
jgi:nicotinate-nucleotide adenylyltransferase